MYRRGKGSSPTKIEALSGGVGDLIGIHPPVPPSGLGKSHTRSVWRGDLQECENAKKLFGGKEVRFVTLLQTWECSDRCFNTAID